MLLVGLLGQPLQKTYTALKQGINQLIATQVSQQENPSAYHINIKYH